jgi:hypothetical protein
MALPLGYRWPRPLVKRSRYTLFSILGLVMGLGCTVCGWESDETITNLAGLEHSRILSKRNLCRHIQSHQRPPLENIALAAGSFTLDAVHCEVGSISHDGLKVCLERRVAKTSREQLSACRMLLDVGHGENIALEARCELCIPVRLLEPTGNPVNLAVTLQVADVDLARSYQHHSAILQMQIMDVKAASTHHGLSLEDHVGEPGMPWTRYSCERSCE